MNRRRSEPLGPVLPTTGGMVGGTVLLGAGVAVFMWSRGKNTEIMTRGVEAIGKAIAIAKAV